MKSPCCGQPAEVMAPIDGNKDAKPRENDVLVCFTCASWLIVTATGLRLFAAEDLFEYPDEELNKLRRLTSLLKQFKKEVPT